MDKEYRDMVKYCLSVLLYRWDAIYKFDTLGKTLKYCANSEGGFTINRGDKDFGHYWFFEYHRNYKYAFWKNHGDNIITEYVDKKLAKDLLNEIWYECKKIPVQLSLFVAE